ncbi:hypothetical protein KA344_00695 [bacterium]|nr:hypothetical protein [bacterium]
MSTENSKNNKNNDESEETKVQVAKTRQMLAASALIPLLCALSQPPNFKALIYTVFIVNYLIKSRAREEAVKAPADSQSLVKTTLTLWQKLEFVALFVACGMIVQTLDYLGHLSFPMSTNWAPSWLWFSTDPGQAVIWQFIMTFRVMVALSVAWLVALRFFVFSEIEFIKIAVGFGVILSLMDSLPVISLPNFTVAVASGIYYGSIAGIAATPLALQKTVQHKGKIGKNEIYILTMTLLFAAIKLVIYLTPTPALGGG